MAIDLDWEEHALRCEAHLVAGWTLAGVPEDEINAYLAATGYGKRLAAYKAARAAETGAAPKTVGVAPAVLPLDPSSVPREDGIPARG